MKRILVTGAASGIGRATALLFAARGWQVLACDRHEAGLAEVAHAGGDRVVPVVGDLSTREGARVMVHAALRVTGGRLDCLFNGAGLLAMGPQHTLDSATVDAMMFVNMHGVIACIDAALPALRLSPDAHIVNMGSSSAEYGTPELAVYSATKFFVRGLTEALDLELRPLGIQVSSVMVAYVRTPMIQHAQNQARSVQRLGVKITPERVAQAVWCAAHGRRTHWRVGLDAVAVHWLVRLLGSASRGVMRRISGV